MAETSYTLTHSQQRIWYSEKLYSGTGMWNNAGTLRIKGILDYALLEKAYNLFVEQNDAVRIRIGIKDGVPYQYVKPYEPVSVELFDFSARGTEKLFEWDSIQTQAPMPLIDSSLVYFALFKLNEEEGGFFAKFHHIILDGLSAIEFTNQFIENYQSLLDGREPQNVKRDSYIDYIFEEQDYLSSQRFLSDKEYWLKRFEMLPEPTVIKQKRSHFFDKKAQRKTFVANEELSSQIRDFCYTNRISVFSVFLSALAIYINRITNKNDIVIGAPVANRTSRQTRRAIGMFISTVPVRIHTDDGLTFLEFAKEVSREWLSALKHQKYPYEVMLSDLRKQNKDLDSLFDVTLSYQIGLVERKSKDFTHVGRWHFSGYQADSLSIHINDRENDGRFIIDYDYHTSLFYGKEIEYVHQHLINIISDMLNNPDKRLYMLNLMSKEEKDRILCRFNDTARIYPQGETLVDIWNKRLKDSVPDDVAVISQGQHMTYAELDERSSKLAALLIKRGVRAESIVGMLVERTFDYCIFVLAILKAGGAFLPIDASLPKERIAYMLKDSGAALLLTSSHLNAKCPDIKGLCVITGDDSEEVEQVCPGMVCGPNNLAYVIYTSGSTGQPKGVQIEHRSIVQFIYSLKDIWDLSKGARILCAASISFDISVMELLLSMMSGNVLVLAQENEVTIPRNMVDLIKTTKVNVMVVTPGRMELLLSDSQGAACLADFREIGLGGDVLSDELLAQVQQATKARIINFYGPTEITICCTCADVTHDKVPNIGKPMHNVKTYILDAHMNAVPIGVPGELYIGGSGVSRGYIGKDELNAERFVDNPFITGQRIYRTGDLARWYPRGEIEFLGRMDKQVKIRGYRIELGEIENRLMQIEGVKACVVADREDANGRKCLCAYLCGNPPEKSIIRAQLLRDLPSYMIPSYYIKMGSLPINTSGKVDRNLLPDPIKDGLSILKDYAPPKTATEKTLADIWSKVLGPDSIGRDDSFFEIGGDSLSIVKVLGKVQQAFHVDIMLEEIFKAPRLKDFAALIDFAEQRDYQPIVAAPYAKHYPVSSAQQRMWVMANVQNAATAYNMPIVLKLSEKPDYHRLKLAFEMLIKRHDALRTSFVLIDSELRQIVHEQADFELRSIKCDEQTIKDEIKKCVYPFDLAKAPLLRAALIETQNGQSLLFIDMHHIISDRRTAEILAADLIGFYKGEKPAPKALEYKDYAVWQQSFLQSNSIKLQEAYWKSALSGELPLLNLRTDKPRGALQRFEGARLRLDIDTQKTQKLKEFAAQHGGTLFMAVLAVYNVLLAKYTGQEDIIVGTPVSGRPRDELNQIAGVFINMLPLRNYPKGEISFSEFFEELCRNTVSALAYSDYPLERMIADLSIPRDAARNPLFDTILVQSVDDVDLNFGDFKAQRFPLDSGVAKLDLTLEICEHPGGLSCELEYNKRLFKKSTIKRIMQHFCRLFELLAQEPDVRLCDVAMLTQQELWQVTQGFNQTDLPLDDSKSIQSLLEEQAKLQPDKTALIVGNEKYTFAQLNCRANHIAMVLRKKGVGRNTIVALCLRRSFDLMAAIFGVLKAGGGYLPLDPSYPADRVSFMLSDCGAGILLSDRSASIEFDGDVLNVQEIKDMGECENPQRIDKRSDAGFIIYTSGSTGIPKGSMIPRHALYNLYESTKTTIQYNHDHPSVSVTSVSFDIFVIDTILPLLFGCTVAMCDEEQLRQPRLLAKIIERHSVKFIQTTPTRMRFLMEDKEFRSATSKHIEKIVLGGEEFPLSLLKKLKKSTNAKIISGYGPSETTVYCTFKDLTNTSHITIGRPIMNTRMYILDKYRRPVPIGVLGEAYISGACVATGYINREELNRNKFTPDPFWPGHMMYQSGDICSFLNNGEIEIHGRVDHQVKIRGLRIELGEIEAALRSFDGIEEAVVKDWGTGAERYLCAYFQAEQNIDEGEIRKYLSGKLPSYMVPSFFVAMQTIPTTLNGKVNRKALLEPDRQKKKGDSANQSGKLNETESLMASIWSKILKVDRICAHDSFFALGGDSLGVIKVQAAAIKYGWKIRTQDFYDYQTLGAICACINKPQPVNKSGVQKISMAPVPEFGHLTKVRLKNILITGATGYLGAYLLEALSDMPDVRVYCLVRGENTKDCLERLRQVLTFYFGIEACAYILGRVAVIKGDISVQGLGLSDEILHKLNVIDTVIHSAALTDHIGHAEAFDIANVKGTRNVVEFVQKVDASLLHISTISVSGTRYQNDSEREGVFTEKCFCIGQNYEDNEYVKSKFLAERIVLQRMKEGMNARIFRVGMLTGSTSGGFQLRPEKNAFANNLKAICQLGYISLGLVSAKVDITPVDSCAKAIIALVSNDIRRPVFHLFNTNTLTLGEVISLLKLNGHKIKVVSDATFTQIINQLSKQGCNDIFMGLSQEISSYRRNIVVTGSMTEQQLLHIGFSWPEINAVYMRGFLDCIMDERITEI